MDSKEVFEWLWNHKPFWKRNSDEEREYKIKLKEIKEYYKNENTNI